MAEFKLVEFGHGGDYNPDQWLDYPEVLDEDIRLMKLASCNLMSVGIFAWAKLEPEEGKYDFGWLHSIIDKLYANGINVLLATPSGARPVWMSQKYPEVLRFLNDRRNHYGDRHNHCFTSPVYRSFVTKMNTRLAEEFGAHPGVKGWHVSNEYSGECHCEYCREAFRNWLKRRYGTLEKLNKEWWTGFWSKTISSWDQIEPPEPNGEHSLIGLSLSWRRFVSDQTLDFIKTEIAPMRKICPDKPVTINTMYIYDLDYQSYADTLDFFGYDAYPRWGSGDDAAVAREYAFIYDYVRGFNGKCWSLMESTPSQVNWQDHCKLKRPGMHMLASMQAVAHGSDTVMMFQWRKGRGGTEKFHGAVVGHDGTEFTRTFRDVSEVGDRLKRLKPMVNADVKSDAALIFDLETRWALDLAQGPQHDKQYHETQQEHYEALMRQGINIDVISQDKSFDGYKLIVAPYLYMLKPGTAEKLTRFVENGGNLVLTYMSGLVNENDLCYLGGFPGPLKELCGLTVEETDGLYPGDENSISVNGGEAGIGGSYKCGFICDIVHTTTAKTVGTYGSDFYAGTPALTVNSFGKGKVWYIASRAPELLFDLYAKLVKEAGVEQIASEIPKGVNVCRRVKDGKKYDFIMNFNNEPVEVNAGKKLTLAAYGCEIIER